MKDLSVQEQYTLSGDLLHHLVNVIRIEKEEELLLLDGKGLSVRTRVTDVAKKALLLSRISETQSRQTLPMDVAIGIPKKDALELCLKEAVELGFRRIFLVRSAYSQTKIPETERITSLLISALEQSNSLFLPQVIESNWDDLPWNDYGTVLLLDSQEGKTKKGTEASSQNLLIVGPEGGFSQAELALIRSKKSVESLLLPTPIMRTPTALAAGAGILLQRLMS